MKSGVHFLIAAKRCEIAELEQLALTGSLVKVVGRLIHELQRERGISNVFLGSHASRFAEQRELQAATCREVEVQARATFETWDVSDKGGAPGNGARLFNRIAYVLHGLDGLAELRQRIVALGIVPEGATAAFSKLIAGLLSVVFEAADSASDPEVSRQLVAMFHFMQGKEFAGQERALGSALFASGHVDPYGQQQWLHLIESQERCFKVFMEFSPAEILDTWLHCMPAEWLITLERLRRVGYMTAAELSTEDSQVWYQIATQRIDAMKTVEESLAANLIKACKDKVRAANAELKKFQKLLDSLRQDTQAERVVASAFFGAHEPQGPLPPAGSPAVIYGPHLERSILDMVQEQSLRLQVMNDELQKVRAALNERKLVERAKGVLMKHRHISEDEAYKLLRQTAMNQNRRVGEVAETILSMSELLPVPPSKRPGQH